MTHFLIHFLTQQRSDKLLLFGLLGLFVLTIPLHFFAFVMAGGSPHSGGAVQTLIKLAQFYCTLIGSQVLIFKLSDSLIAGKLCWNTFSIMGIFISSFVYMIYFNIYVDNLFQFNQGNYAISAYFLMILLAFWVAVIALGYAIVKYLY